MNEYDKKRPIGMIDSGLGGISVLKKCINIMPFENYIYYGDSLNAPYGTKSVEEVRRLTLASAEYLMTRGVKGIVIACNTATSAAVKLLRESNPEFPIVGIEPAVKPAAIRHPGSMVLVMATENTLREAKFLSLKAQYEKMAEIVKVPCSGLMEFVERGELEGPVIESYFKNLLKDIPMYRVGAIVLGCTHYPFVAHTLQKIVGEHIEIIDGSMGTARELRRRLDVIGMLNLDKTVYGNLEIVNSAVENSVVMHYNGEKMVPEIEPTAKLHKQAIMLLEMENT